VFYYFIFIVAINSLDYIFTFLLHSHHCKALNSLICADVPLRIYSITHSLSQPSNPWQGTLEDIWCKKTTVPAIAAIYYWLLDDSRARIPVFSIYLCVGPTDKRVGLSGPNTLIIRRYSICVGMRRAIKTNGSVKEVHLDTWHAAQEKNYDDSATSLLERRCTCMSEHVRTSMQMLCHAEIINELSIRRRQTV